MFMVFEKIRAVREKEAGAIIHDARVPGLRMCAHVLLTVLAAEDQRFLQHRGFDVKSIKKAWKDHQKGRPLPSASTISQQTAKNLFLRPGRSYVRKFHRPLGWQPCFQNRKIFRL